MSTLLQYWRAGGPLMVPLAGLCFAIWCWTITLYAKLRRANASAAGLNEIYHGESAGGVLTRIKNWTRDSCGPLARAAVYATEGDLSARVVRDRLAEARLVEIPAFAAELAFLKAMVVAAPLVGLLGTVKGMIETFTVLSARGTASMQLVSAGISEALVTTQAGLVAALPGLIGAYAIGRLLARMKGDFDRIESHLVAASARGGGDR
jgi:biopolymer transport protein ExbB